ncbi:hypothetical protein BLOT_000026 [Blomia tropicalis]|nr:hypothetical protein BLOT_000026 [Blomia tropicalis]
MLAIEHRHGDRLTAVYNYHFHLPFSVYGPVWLPATLHVCTQQSTIVKKCLIARVHLPYISTFILNKVHAGTIIHYPPILIKCCTLGQISFD